MPEYFDSTSSKPKKTKKTRYAGGGGIETYNAQIQRKYHGGSVKRKQAGSKLPLAGGLPGGLAQLKKDSAENPEYAKWFRQMARLRGENISSGKSAKYGVSRKPKLKGKTKRGAGPGDE